LDTERIIDALKAERLRIDNAIAVLGGGTGRGAATSHRRGPRRMSAAARKRISDAQKKRWAKLKRGK